MIENKTGNAAAFFDLDHTIVPFFTEKKFVKYLYVSGSIGRTELFLVIFAFLKHKLGLIRDYDTVKQRISYILVQGKSAIAYRSMYQLFFSECLRPAIHTEIYREVARHRKHNRRIYIISAATDLVVGEFSEYLGLDGFYAQRLEEHNGLFTGRHMEPSFFGTRKAKIIRDLAIAEHLDLAQSYAYGDSILDRYMLEIVGNPVAVNPDKKLNRLALNKRWTVMKF